MSFQKNKILIIASMAIFVEALDIAIINLSIPAIQKQFLVSNNQVQWLQTLYVLLYGGFLIIGGKLSDVFGPKKVFIAGAGLFLLTSLGAGLAGTFAFLSLSRAMQGLAAALIMPSAFSIITHTFTKERERSKAIGIFSSFAAVGSGTGLSAGGIISTYMGWHWVFLINVPVLAIVIVVGWFYLASDTPEQKHPAPDLFSGILVVMSLLMLSYGVHQLADIKQQFSIIMLCVLGVVISVRLLYVRLTRRSNPLIDLSVFKAPSVITANGVFVLLGGFFTGYLFIISQLLQKDMHYSAAKAGLLLVPFSLLSALVAKFILPGIMKRLTTGQTGVLGMSFMLTGGLILICTVFVGYSLPLVLLSAAFISGLGMTICFTSLSVLGVKNIPKQHYGLASSLGNTTYFLGAGVGLSILTLFMEKGNEKASVSSLSLFILSIYALIGLVWLIVYVVNSTNKNAPVPLPKSQRLPEVF
ncbi:MFS transporter [Mucilaginibacter sp. SMC90]|uniref:MFS transporter n=1 Tax=Mucilaginibacter sp. SMC90 TaxID=2929803 RepID=UPI001FB2778A|nr:MFS transporter [Mucilaginibacter sp. SMC90]UOE51664.1 MFS transporter [Mucilaginibacter sp. SMC90]